MFENLKLRWFLIICSLVFGFYFTYPTYNYYTQKDIVDESKLTELQNSAINLGLDLKGGLHIVLELDEKFSIVKR